MVHDEWADLHVHTCYSDGILRPSEVVEKAKEVGLKAVGIVDHDCVDGIPEAREVGDRLGVEIVPGIELSCQYQGKDIHIIAYYCDLNHPQLVEYLTHFQDERYQRALKMVRNLNNQGVKISIEDVQRNAKGKSIGRPHIAEVLMEKGYVETFQEAFHRFIGYTSKAYEEKYRIMPEEALRIISDVGGLSFLAHPGHTISMEAIFNFTKAGLDGIEIVHPQLNDRRTLQLQQFAQNHGLLVSGGSDCHGGREGRLNIGNYRVPYAILTEMQNVIKIRKRQMSL